MSNKGPDFAFQQSKMGRKEKKCLEERNGECDRRGDGSSIFIVKKTRISVQLQLLLDSLRTSVVSLEVWILPILVWVIIT